MKNLKNINYPNFDIEKTYADDFAIGIDEVGRGSIAGPVVACAAYINPSQYQDKNILTVNDSKKISKKKRRLMFEFLIVNIKFAIGIVEREVIDDINILESTKLAMFNAYKKLADNLGDNNNIVLVDGNFDPFLKFDVKPKKVLPVVKGDQKSLSIACASIIAKESRDDMMTKLHAEFPYYDWNKNSGYPTKFHIEKINQCGITSYHRRSFAPVQKILNK